MMKIPNKFKEGSPEAFLYRLFNENSFYNWYEWPDPEQKLLDMAGDTSPYAERLLELVREEAQKPDHDDLVGLELQRVIGRILRDKIFIDARTKRKGKRYVVRRLVPVAIIYRQFLGEDLKKSFWTDVKEHYEQATVSEIVKMLGTNEKTATIIKDEISGFSKATYSKYKIEGIRFSALVLVKGLNDSDYIARHWPNTAEKWWPSKERHKVLATQEPSDVFMLFAVGMYKVKGQWKFVTEMLGDNLKALTSPTVHERLQQFIQLSFPNMSPSQA